TPRENHSSNPTTSSALSLSVVVPTRNRPEHARECAASIIKNQSFVDLIVVDQSDGLETEREIATLSDPRIRYLRTPTRGVTSARNLGIEHSRSDIVAFTDDDCRVPQDWTDKIIQVFVDDPAAVVVCGRVKVPEELWQKGFTESFEPHQREWLRRYPPFGRDWGITANMSMRRQLVVELGCFDPMLGAGSPLRSGGEPDLIFRVLRAGLKVVNAAEIELDHLGVRPYGEAATKLMRGYGFGTGAAFFKHVRLGDAEAAALCMRFFAQNVSRIGHSLLHTARPTGLGYLIGFVSGAAASYKFGVDRKQRRYVRR
ncbi:MAG TPA: glycosyltransferase, partial [Polyangiales bacterium]|nr:glycosyltransferase [Polyangiales bacterium]